LLAFFGDTLIILFIALTTRRFTLKFTGTGFLDEDRFGVYFVLFGGRTKTDRLGASGAGFLDGDRFGVYFVLFGRTKTDRLGASDAGYATEMES
jgi:hypothetical protein